MLPHASPLQWMWGSPSPSNISLLSPFLLFEGRCWSFRRCQALLCVSFPCPLCSTYSTLSDLFEMPRSLPDRAVILPCYRSLYSRLCSSRLNKNGATSLILVFLGLFIYLVYPILASLVFLLLSWVHGNVTASLFFSFLVFMVPVSSTSVCSPPSFSVVYLTLPPLAPSSLSTICGGFRFSYSCDDIL